MRPAVSKVLLSLSLLVLLAAPAAQAQLCTRTDRFDLSPTAAEVLARIEANSAALSDSPTRPSMLLSTCNRFVAAPVDGPAIFEQVRDLIAQAEHEVSIGTFGWEHPTYAGRMIGDGLIAAQSRFSVSNPLIVRLMQDDAEADHLRVINRFHDSHKDWVSRGLDRFRVQVQFATVPRTAFFSANYHDKYVIVDGRFVLVTGANVQADNNPPTPWHDSGYVLEGDAARSTLDAFDESWKDPGTRHWACYPVNQAPDCQEIPHYPQPDRSWMPPFGSQVVGNVPVLAVGRGKAYYTNSDTDTAQDIAWMTLMEKATSHIWVESPNINDDAFQAGIIAAVGRGVRVRLITSMGFNDFYMDLPGLGGSNMEVVGNLRKTIRARTPWFQDRFEVRWYGKNGLYPVEDNGPGASHTKYMSVDSQIAMVGSGNQDTISWNIAHEFNLMIDDPAATAQIEAAVFIPDWASSVGTYAELYEANGGLQDLVCPIFVLNDHTQTFNDQQLTELEFIDTWRCNNDEARSILLHDVPAGRVLRFYDSPSRDHRDDDWTEIVVKRPVSRKYISTFQQTFEDGDVQVFHHRDNGLDGKISSVEVSGSPVGPVVDLYEGNGGTQSLVCSKQAASLQSVNFQNDSACDNDETRSLVLTNFPDDKVIFVWDSPSGSTGDDWTVIVPKRHLFRTVVSSYESSYENDDVRVCAFRDNGLDGKVSRLRIGARSEAVGVCTPTRVPASKGRTYAVSPSAGFQYPDAGGELTDGITSTGTDWVQAAGWIHVDPVLTLDLAQSRTLTAVEMYVGNSFGNGSYAVGPPASVAVQTSTDGVTWTSAGSLTFSAHGALASKGQVDRGRLALSATARWVRFLVTRGSAWTMVTEIVAEAEASGGVFPPDPTLPDPTDPGDPWIDEPVVGGGGGDHTPTGGLTTLR